MDHWPENAREMLLVGSDEFDAAYAKSVGLVNDVVAEKDLLASAFAMARKIALNDPLAVRLTKKALNRGQEIAGMRRALEAVLKIDIEIESTDTPESREFNRILDEDGPKAALAWRESFTDTKGQQ